MPKTSIVAHRHLDAFRTVVLAGGFTRAAKLLATSQPSISRLMQELQGIVGFALFTRVGGQVVPTAEALELLQEIEQSFTGIDKVMQRAADIREQGISRLRIVSMPALAHGFLPRVVAQFLSTRPTVRASLQVQRSELVPSWIRSQQFDVGFAMLPIELPGIEVELFDRADGVCVMPRDHPLAGKHAIDIGDLEDVPFVASGPDSLVQREIERVFRNAGFVPRSQVQTPLSAIACQFVVEGCGVTIADPFTAASFATQGLVARPFRPVVSFNFGVIYPTHVARPQLVTQFVQAARGFMPSPS